MVLSATNLTQLCVLERGERASDAMARLFVALAAVGSVGALNGTVDCLSAGFTDALRCSSCAKLEALVSDGDLSADCRACCAEESAGASTFASARLEICK